MREVCLILEESYWDSVDHAEGLITSEQTDKITEPLLYGIWNAGMHIRIRMPTVTLRRNTFKEI